jgi:hypothetical protein
MTIPDYCYAKVMIYLNFSEVNERAPGIETNYKIL